jgi:hypothetical protein
MGLQGRTSKPIAVVSRSVVSRSRDIWYRTGIGLAPAAGLFCLEGQCSTHQRDRVEYASLRHTSTSLRLRLRTFDARPLTSVAAARDRTGRKSERCCNFQLACSDDVGYSPVPVRCYLACRGTTRDRYISATNAIRSARHCGQLRRWDKPSRPGRCPQEPGPRSPSSPQTQPRSEPVAIPHTPRHAVHPNPECYTS